MIRTIFVWFCIAVATLILGSLVIIVYPFDRSGKTGHGIARLWAKVPCWAGGVKIKVEGLGHVEGKSPHIFMANHQGSYDIFALHGYLPFHFKWLAKKELFSIPVLGWAMAAAGYIAIDREGTRETVKAMNAAAQKIQEGMSVLIFPEGSRSPDGSIQPFKKGGFSLAIKSKVPIIPVAIVGSREIMPKGELAVHSGQIRIRVGSSIETKDCTLKDWSNLMRRVAEAISENFHTISEREG